MEELIINVLGSVPIAVGVLIAGVLIWLSDNKREIKREEHRAREMADRNKREQTLINLVESANQNAGALRQFIEANTHALQLMDQEVKAQHEIIQANLNALKPLLKSAETLKQGVQSVSNMCQTIIELINRPVNGELKGVMDGLMQEMTGIRAMLEANEQTLSQMLARIHDDIKAGNALPIPDAPTPQGIGR